MSEYVKIKRSKNLRFRLISLMYLIFIVLSMTQIPVAWLKIGSPIASYFNQFVFPDYIAAYEDKYLYAGRRQAYLKSM